MAAASSLNTGSKSTDITTFFSQAKRGFGTAFSLLAQRVTGLGLDGVDDFIVRLAAVQKSLIHTQDTVFEISRDLEERLGDESISKKDRAELEKKQGRLLAIQSLFEMNIVQHLATDRLERAHLRKKYLELEAAYGTYESLLRECGDFVEGGRSSMQQALSQMTIIRTTIGFKDEWVAAKFSLSKTAVGNTLKSISDE